MKMYCHSLLEDALKEHLAVALSGQYTVYFRSNNDTENRMQFQSSRFILGNPPVDWFESVRDDLIFWQLDSAGFNQYSQVKLNKTARVANMADWFARPCAETIIGGILAQYRGIDRLTSLKNAGRWVGALLRADLKVLFNQKVAILGAGNIGTAVYEIVKGFGCQTEIFARTSPLATVHTKEELLAKLSSIDLVINTLPGTLHHFADRDFFQSMKKGSVYSSVGRGNTTDENALIDYLQNGHLDGAVLDVTEQEPLPPESPLWKMRNVVLTQHTGGGQVDEDAGKIDLLLRNIRAIEIGEQLRGEIVLGRGY